MNKVTFEKVEDLSFQANEAYKSLRTNIQFCGEDVKAIVFTSCIPNEGKSILVFRLACAMAESGKKVLLMDTDIRKSVLVTRFQVDKVVKGLSEYLTGQCRLEDCLCTTNMEDMDVIFTGPVAPNPSELLGSSKFKELIQKVREEYDYVLIDCPPLGSVIDAAVVASVADGAILVIESDVISRRFALNVKQQLEKSGCRIIGGVLNKVDMEGKGYYGHYGHYYGKYYGNYYGKEEEKEE